MQHVSAESTIKLVPTLRGSPLKFARCSISQLALVGSGNSPTSIREVTMPEVQLTLGPLAYAAGDSNEASAMFKGNVFKVHVR
jgi:hypothetical protein